MLNAVDEIKNKFKNKKPNEFFYRRFVWPYIITNGVWPALSNG